MFARAVRTAIDLFPGRDAMSDHPALAMRAGGREVMDGALEAVVCRALSTAQDLE